MSKEETVWIRFLKEGFLEEMKLKLDREEGGRLGSAEKARKVILEKRKRKVGKL